MKKHLLLTITMILSLAFGPALVKAQSCPDGLGQSAANPFLIPDTATFYAFARCMDPGSPFYYDCENQTFVAAIPDGADASNYIYINSGGAGKHFKLTADLVLNRGDISGCNGVNNGYNNEPWIVWQPMHTFNGHLDGDFHTISGLFLPNGDNQCGLFYAVSTGAVVENLGVTNAYISGKKYVGGISGSVLDNGVIQKCFFEGNIKSSDNFCGGITGYTVPDENGTSLVTNCYATGSIYSSGYYTGGIVGENGTTISNCYSTMYVSNVTGGTIGGVYGKNDGNITNCYFDKQMTNQTGNLATAKLTTEMAVSNFTDLGAAFVAQQGFYPYLSGFDFSTNPAVRLSVLPIFFTAVSTSQYETAETLTQDFSVGDAEGATWTATSINNCVTISGTQVTLNKQGVANLVVSLGGISRTYVIYPNVAPYLGVAENPFTIDNLEDLISFRDGVNSGLDFRYKRYDVLVVNLPNTYWLQTADISLKSISNWTPIGIVSSVPFTGHYDGGGHVLDSLTMVTDNKNNKTNKALFLYVKNATISGVNLTNVNIKSHGSYPAATLCYYMMSSSIDHCSASSTVTCQSVGLIGFVGSGTCYIRHCTNKCNYQVLSSGCTYGGGILSFLSGGASTTAYVEDCVNEGNIACPDGNYYFVGGIVGGSSSEGVSIYITRCLNTGTIRGCYAAAGIIARSYYIKGSVKCCINTGDIYCNSSNANIGSNAGGISCSWCKTGGITTVEECINTGRVFANIKSNLAGGIEGYGATVYNCINAGVVSGDFYESNSFKTYGIASKARYSYNITSGYGVSYYPCDDATNSTNFFDKQFCLNASRNEGRGRTTAKMIGANSVMKSTLSESIWIFKDSLYPRLKWTDTVAWARPIAIAVCTPVLLSSEDQDANHVKEGLKIFGCDSSVTWKIQEPVTAGVGGCLFQNFAAGSTITGTCLTNAITPTLSANCLGTTVIGAYTGDKLVKLVTLQGYVPPRKDTLCINTEEDLISLRDGVNSGEAFLYHDTALVPRLADSTYFKLCADITLTADSWTAIGNDRNPFNGYFLGNGYTISGLKSSNRYAGLFGLVTGRIHGLNMEDVKITGGTYKGAVAANLSGGRISNCTVSGTISGGDYYTGGIVGWCKNSTDTVSYCTNYANVTVSGTNGCGGGIVGAGGLAWGCVNAGTVLGGGACLNLGGITGNSTVSRCYNVGSVTALPGNGSADNYVGGIAGNGTVVYSYNSGIVNGSNRKYVGGINGAGTAKWCYNSNTVRGTGTSVGSITGKDNTSTTKCVYDKQLSTFGGVAGNDVDSKAVVGYLTEAMLQNQLSGKISPTSEGDTVWTFSSSLLYPQLTCLAGTNASISSVMPVSLNATDANNYNVWKNVPNGAFFNHGCDVGQWKILQGGACAQLNNDAQVCNTTIAGMGILKMGAEVGGTVYREVRLLVGLDQALEIINATELANFRDAINSPVGYYNMTTKHFQTALSHEDSTNIDLFLEISDGGLDLTFKLNPDEATELAGYYDISSYSDWTPIGDYATNTDYLFQGNFLGNNQTIKGLNCSTDANYRGLFGRINGNITVRDLTIVNAKVGGNGNYRGVLAGMGYGCVIDKCKLISDTVTGTGDYVGGMCGSMYFGTMRHSTANQCVVDNTGAQTGGFVGHVEHARIDTCTNTQFNMTGTGNYKGGICGYNYCGNIYGCILQNSNINVEGATSVGGIAGLSRSDIDNVYPARFYYCGNINNKLNSTSEKLGGILGSVNYTSSNKSVRTFVFNCYSTGGSITSTAKNVGGIAGDFLYQSSGCLRRCYNETPVKGTTYVGGICGSARQTTIDSCYNTAKVVATADEAGGILGYSQYGGKIKYCYNIGNVVANNYVGGIVGSLHEGNTNYAYYCFNLGNVTAKQNGAGGIAGRSEVTSTKGDGHVEHCFNAGIVKGISQVGGILGL